MPRCMADFGGELAERGEGVVLLLLSYARHASSFFKIIQFTLAIDNHEHLSPSRLNHRVHLPCQHLPNTVRQ